jgi:hypothetical protein
MCACPKEVTGCLGKIVVRAYPWERQAMFFDGKRGRAALLTQAKVKKSGRLHHGGMFNAERLYRLDA